ncbi:MAG: stage V sporulation protein AA [Eubacteriales bacterium]|nr:stage V sporulation protein AA [Eubacteriales bacterium]
MQKETLYLKLERNVEIQTQEVRFKDLGKLYCRDQNLLNRIKAEKIVTLKKEDGGRKVVCVMKLIEMLQKEYPNLEVENIGEAEVVLELVKTNKYKGAMQAAKICFVCGICFFGAAFTIMAFHNDVGIIKTFSRVYEMITGQASDGVTILEISYSIGLALGIIVFFNHIGGRRITKDPTPIEVEMRIYEKEVNDTLVETADREGKMLDVD